MSVFPSFCLVDHTKRFTTPELTRAALALLAQVNRDVAPAPPFGYGLSCFVHASQAPQPFEWQIGLFTDPDQPGALGYHDETPSGLPLAKVFPFLDPSQPWTVTASHELVETLVDPLICKVAQSPIDGKMWAYEPCDAVEQDTYEINGVTVSNFVLPPYFETPRQWQKLKLDHLGLVKRPLELRPGGYGQFFEPGTGWQQVLADRQSGYRAALKNSRSERRKHAPSVTALANQPDGGSKPQETSHV